ncbi:MAG: hypothetical protein LAT55_07340 [Opitutales bacterium]|nr:hypothetical protein [Opitutales bacterium]
MKFAIGIDGGGTCTDLFVMDPEGKILAEERISGTSPSYLSGKEIRPLLESGRDRLLAQLSLGPEEIAYSQFCMSGSPRFWEELLEGWAGWGKINFCSDAEPLLDVATEGKPGMVLHSGTTSFIVVRGTDGEVQCAGGLGVVFGDPGSAQDIGRRGFAKAMLQIQGWYPRTMLAEALERSSGKTEYGDILAYFYDKDKPRRYLANFASEIMSCAREGDFAARDAVVESVVRLVDLARAVSRKSGLSEHPEIPFYTSGPILRQPLVLQIIRSQIERDSIAREIFPLRASPVEGVRQRLFRNWLAAM